MSELGLQRLQSLGFQFWSLRKVNKKTLKNKEKEDSIEVMDVAEMIASADEL